VVGSNASIASKGYGQIPNCWAHAMMAAPRITRAPGASANQNPHSAVVGSSRKASCGRIAAEHWFTRSRTLPPPSFRHAVHQDSGVWDDSRLDIFLAA
jgi:hypothetical protein